MAIVYWRAFLIGWLVGWMDGRTIAGCLLLESFVCAKNMKLKLTTNETKKRQVDSSRLCNKHKIKLTNSKEWERRIGKENSSPTFLNLKRSNTKHSFNSNRWCTLHIHATIELCANMYSYICTNKNYIIFYALLFSLFLMYRRVDQPSDVFIQGQRWQCPNQIFKKSNTLNSGSTVNMCIRIAMWSIRWKQKNEQSAFFREKNTHNFPRYKN